MFDLVTEHYIFSAQYVIKMLYIFSQPFYDNHLTC